MGEALSTVSCFPQQLSRAFDDGLEHEFVEAEAKREMRFDVEPLHRFSVCGRDDVFAV